MMNPRLTDQSGERISGRSVRVYAPLAKEQGVWVFRTGQPLSASATDETLWQIWEERDMVNLGHLE